MSTVNFQCGFCNQTIAASRDHLGQPVECPHCQQVVQVPSDAPEGEATEVLTMPPPVDIGATEPQFSAKPAAEQESIFSSPDVDLSDDVFGSPVRKAVEMPSEEPVTDLVPNLQLQQQQQQPAAIPDHTVSFLQPPPVPPPEHAATATFTDAAPLADAPPLSGTGLPAPSIRQPRAQKGGSLGILLLIFLIPYALVTTGCIAYLLYLLDVERNKPAPFDPLERLPDPDKNKGGAKRVKHDIPLPDKLRTALGRSLSIGDLEVTPVAVNRKDGRLFLHLRLHNTSTDTAFDPLPRFFVEYTPRNAADNKPYTFLQVGDKNAYGAKLSFDSTPPRKGSLFDGILKPGETSVVVLETTAAYEGVALLASAYPDTMLWRVQVRRGFVDVKGHDVSATALIGVEFRKDDIADERGARLLPPAEPEASATVLVSNRR